MRRLFELADNQLVLELITVILIGGGFAGCGVLWYFMVYKGSRDERLREDLDQLERALAEDDPFAGRAPTSHERMTGEPWDESYRDGPAPWDVGRPQPAVVRLASRGAFSGAVLDAGCGTGENALHLAAQGFAVLGFDVADTALALARSKAHERGLQAQFASADALHLERMGGAYSTVLDCGLFHTFDEGERHRYIAGLASVTEHHGTLYVLCFSDEGPATGPHPVTQDELREAFVPSAGWEVVAIEPERIATLDRGAGAPAWLATIKRI